MASGDGAGTAAFVGRAQERDRVRSVLRAARDGQMAALLVSGEAGIGKTRLVGNVCAESGDDGLVVMGGVCLPMGATTVPLMPLRTAFRRVPEGMSAPVLDEVAHHGGAPVAVNAWLDDVCRDRAVVLVVDDVQWADEASLDVLTYVLAGPADRNLAVLLTLRREEVGVGHPVRRWLADVRRRAPHHSGPGGAAVAGMRHALGLESQSRRCPDRTGSGGPPGADPRDSDLH